MTLDGVAFSRLDWLYHVYIFGFLEVRQFFISLRLANVPECLYCRWKVKCSSFNPKNGSIHKNRKWLSWDRENYIFAQKWLRCKLRAADVSPSSSPLRDVSRGGTSATQRQKFHTDDVNQCLHNKSGSHGVPNANLFNFTFLLVDFGKVLCLAMSEEKLLPFAG